MQNQLFCERLYLLLSCWVFFVSKVHHILIVLLYLGLGGLGLWGENVDYSEDKQSVLLLKTVHELILRRGILSVYFKIGPLLIAFCVKTILKCELFVFSGLIWLISRGFRTYMISLRLSISFSPQPLLITLLARITSVEIILFSYPFLLFFHIKFLLSLVFLLILLGLLFEKFDLLFKIQIVLLRFFH